MGSVVVLQCQQNIANVPQASTNSLLPHPRCATVSTPSSSSDDKSRAGSKERNNRENGGSVASSYYIYPSYSVEMIFFTKFIEFFNNSKD